MNAEVLKEERPGYLTRVLEVGGRDGELGPRELRVLNGIMRRIGADHGDLATAIAWHREGRALPPLRSPLVRMQNVQDMVMVALADGDLAAHETGPIEKLAAALRYSQADMDIIVKRAESELTRILSRVTETHGIEALFAPPKPPPLPTASTPAESPEQVVGDAEASDEWGEEEAIEEAAVEEEAVEEKVAESTLQNELPDVLACAACREASGEGSSYCFGAQTGELNVWGCKLLGMPWLPGAEWLTLGAFHGDESFEFDRGAIGEALADAMEGVAGCPYFNDAVALMALAELPRAASLFGRWALRESSRGEKVQTMEYLHGCGIRRECRATGVDPVGPQQAAKLIRRILSRLDMQA